MRQNANCVDGPRTCRYKWCAMDMAGKMQSLRDLQRAGELPFLVMAVDSAQIDQTSPYPSEWDYFPERQTTNLFEKSLEISGVFCTGILTDSDVTTRSRIGSTGIFNDDSDEDNDDRGSGRD
jgi:hypothetical protein